MRQLLLLISATLASVVTGVYVWWIAWPGIQRDTAGLAHADAEWIQLAAVAEVCGLFMAVLFGSGALFARRMLGERAADQISREGRWRGWAIAAIGLLATIAGFVFRHTR